MGLLHTVCGDHCTGAFFHAQSQHPEMPDPLVGVSS